MLKHELLTLITFSLKGIKKEKGKERKLLIPCYILPKLACFIFGISVLIYIYINYSFADSTKANIIVVLVN